MKFSKDITFIRWGNLNLVKQEGYTTDPTLMNFHTPPARHGIYAFPEKFIETFLLGKRCYDQKMHEIIKRSPTIDELNNCVGSSVWKDEKSREQYFMLPINDTETRDKFYREHTYIVRQKTPKKFTYTKNLWHHLRAGLESIDILKTQGEWVLTTMGVYKKQLMKEAGKKYCDALKGNRWAKDHFEVFISDKI